MSARATGSATISFGLVSIPIKLYTATSPKTVSFNMLHKECGSRVKMQLFCPVDAKVIERSDTVKGYEHTKDQFVRFEEDELKKLQAEKSDALDIAEFVPEGSIDPIWYADAKFTAPDKGGDRAYKLLAESMARSHRVAVGRLWSHGKTQLVVLRPYGRGLVMHQMYFADEVRSFDEVPVPTKVAFKPGEEELADKLIAQLTAAEWKPEQYRDEWRERVMAAIEQKVAGQEIVTPAAAPQAEVIDLFEALKRSLASKGEAAAVNENVPSKPPPAEKSGGGEPAAAVEAEAEAPAAEKKPLKKASPRRAAKKAAG